MERAPAPALILASASPRRREILSNLGLDFQVMASEIDETPLSAEAAPEYVMRLARDKAKDVAARLAQAVVIGADTIVVVDDQLLGKPSSTAQARTMLQQLSQRWHQVLTGVAVINTSTQQQAVDHCITRVKFSALTPEEIEWYLQTREPFGKAGGYAIQGYASLFIEEIAGNYLNVVGLPITLLRHLLGKTGYQLIC